MLEVAGQAKVGCTSAGAASPFGASGICSLDDSFVPVPVRGPASLCTWALAEATRQGAGFEVRGTGRHVEISHKLWQVHTKRCDKF
eukprot:scaffold14705_cov56-Phaeocystis_antarctica.AAC.4